ncbi:MAG: hypothetical protein LPK46_11215 [Bacteroidota bacterium]|nr:hypothetical protein [Bacteroidota bacterium]MDX5506694.1 hypothetical protein [Bacteroidota bacterium]
MTTRKLSLRFALFIYLGIVVFFLIMKVLGLESFTELRVFNFVIVLYGLYFLVRKNMDIHGTDYFENLFLAFRTSALSILFTIISLILYLSWIDPAFMRVLEDSLLWGRDLSVIQVAMAIGVEGLASSFILAFMVMQYMKNYIARPTLFNGH